MSLGVVQKLVDERGAMQARKVLEFVTRSDLPPISADHIRVAEALLLDPDDAGGVPPERTIRALRDFPPKRVVISKIETLG